MKQSVNRINKRLYVNLVVLCLISLTHSSNAQNQLMISPGIDVTTLKDEISSPFNFKGIIPTIEISYISEKISRIHQTKIEVGMGKPKQIYDLRSLLMRFNIGYSYLQNLNLSDQYLNYLGGGIQTYNNFLIHQYTPHHFTCFVYT